MSAIEGDCGNAEGRGIFVERDVLTTEKTLQSCFTVSMHSSGIERGETQVLTGIGVWARDGKRSDWLSPYRESRNAVAVNMCDSEASAAARDENAGAP